MTLRRIERSQLRVGMYVAKIEGAWWKSPLWRRRLLVSNVQDLQALRESAVPGLWIDESKGAPLDVPTPVKAEPFPTREAASAPRATPRQQGFGRRDERADMDMAKATLAQSRQAVVKLFGEARLGRAPTVADIDPVVEELTGAVLDNKDALLKVCRIKSKSQTTYLHSIAVSALMINLARQMKLGAETIRAAGIAGLLHDIGKITVPNEVLDKTEALTAEEQAQVQGHVQKGHELLLASGQMLPAALDMCLHHHERLDGSGYPFGLAGEKLTRFARMGAICDSYDDLTSNGPRQRALAPVEAIEEMRARSAEFDGLILEEFIQAVGVYPVGTLVRLRTNRLGVISAAPADAKGKPRVKAFYAIVEHAFLPVDDVTIGESLKDDQIVGVERPESWFMRGGDEVAARVLEGRAAADIEKLVVPWIT